MLDIGCTEFDGEAFKQIQEWLKEKPKKHAAKKRRKN